MPGSDISLHSPSLYAHARRTSIDDLNLTQITELEDDNDLNLMQITGLLDENNLHQLKYIIKIALTHQQKEPKNGGKIIGGKKEPLNQQRLPKPNTTARELKGSLTLQLKPQLDKEHKEALTLLPLNLINFLK